MNNKKGNFYCLYISIDISKGKVKRDFAMKYLGSSMNYLIHRRDAYHKAVNQKVPRYFFRDRLLFKCDQHRLRPGNFICQN